MALPYMHQLMLDDSISIDKLFIDEQPVEERKGRGVVLYLNQFKAFVCHRLAVTGQPDQPEKFINKMDKQ